MRTMADFLEHFRRQRGWTRTLVEAIPSEHFDWAPTESAFSCGDLVRHLMQAEVFWCRLLTRAAAGGALDPFALEGTAEERLRAFRPGNLAASHEDKYGESVEDCLVRWATIQERTEREFAAVPDVALYEVEVDHPLTRMEAPLWQMLLTMVEHEGHHRGQLSAYLKFLGVEQPAAVVGT